MILNNSQVLERGDWQKKIGAEIITTGNELSGQQIAEFSKSLDVKGAVPKVWGSPNYFKFISEFKSAKI